MAIVRAAGGLLWRDGASGPEVALVHRPRRNDWSLPKGKLDGGESWEEAALREVEEETGCRARITGFAGATSYVGKRAPKLVLYWHMAVEREGPLDAGDEIDEVAWLAPVDALVRLDYDADRGLLARVRPGGVRPVPRGPGRASVAEARADVLRRVLALGAKGDGAGLGPALELLDLADGAAGEGDASALVLTARRLALLSAEDAELVARARALREEARTLAPWRRRAIRALLPRGGRVSPEAVYVAAAIRDDADAARPGPAGRAHRRLAGGLLLAGALGLAAVAVSFGTAGVVLTGVAAGVAGGALAALAILAGSARERARR